MHHAVDEAQRREHRRASHRIVAFEALTLVARSRCRLCCVRRTQLKTLPNATGAGSGATFGAANADGRAADPPGLANGLSGFVSACAAAVGTSKA
jgi:hypothetical protein